MDFVRARKIIYSKFLLQFSNRARRDEAKISAWENLQKAKAEAAIRKLEVYFFNFYTSYLLFCVFIFNFYV